MADLKIDFNNCDVSIEKMFDIHDNQNVNVYNGNGNPASKGRGKVSAETDAPRDDADLVEKLKPVFYNNEADVRLFLKEISGMKPGDITDLVNTWVKDKRISSYGNSRKGALWEILNEAGLYPRSRQNWCRRVY